LPRSSPWRHRFGAKTTNRRGLSARHDDPQIVGGVPPAEAVKYQILVMFLIAGGTGLGAVTAVLGGVYRLTDGRHRLRLDRLRPPKPA
jgi:hypothetical protein